MKKEKSDKDLIESLQIENLPPPKKMVRFDALPEERIAAAFIKCKGMQKLAAELLGVASSTLTDRVSLSPYLQQIRRECLERRLDMAELKLAKKVEEDEDLGAICFTLKTIGKHRGYTENPSASIEETTSSKNLEILMTQLDVLQESLKRECTKINSDKKS